MAKFRRLVEQVSRDDLFSPFFVIVRHMEPEEVQFLEEHESEPSATNVETPPAQVEWQWDTGDVVYNCHLLKEVYNNNRRQSKPEDDVAKRYKLLGFAYNKPNNMTGLVSDYSDVSEEFNETFDTGVLDRFLERQDFLYESDTADAPIFTFTRPSDLEI